MAVQNYSGKRVSITLGGVKYFDGDSFDSDIENATGFGKEILKHRYEGDFVETKVGAHGDVENSYLPVGSSLFDLILLSTSKTNDWLWDKFEKQTGMIDDQGIEGFGFMMKTRSGLQHLLSASIASIKNPGVLSLGTTAEVMTWVFVLSEPRRGKIT